MARWGYVVGGVVLPFFGIAFTADYLPLGVFVILLGLILVLYGVWARRPSGQPQGTAPTRVVYQAPPKIVYRAAPPPMYPPAGPPLTVNVEPPTPAPPPPQILRRCSFCGRMFPENLGKCPSCGASF